MKKLSVLCFLLCGSVFAESALYEKGVLQGAPGAEMIREEILRNMPAMRYCYQVEVVKDPSIKGEMLMKFSISKKTGSPYAVLLSNDMNADMRSCLFKAIRQFNFPPYSEGKDIEVNQPVNFKTVGI